MAANDPSVHPLCEILPAMPDSEFSMLVEDIKAKGLVRAITLFEGKILDGRHRFAACRKAGVQPRFEEYTGNALPHCIAAAAVDTINGGRGGGKLPSWWKQ